MLGDFTAKAVCARLLQTVTMQPRPNNVTWLKLRCSEPVCVVCQPLCPFGVVLKVVNLDVHARSCFIGICAYYVDLRLCTSPPPNLDADNMHTVDQQMHKRTCHAPWIRPGRDCFGCIVKNGPLRFWCCPHCPTLSIHVECIHHDFVRLCRMRACLGF